MSDRQQSKTAVVIMAGGIGERFWPLSTPEWPKQFLNLVDDKSLLEHTIERALKIVEQKDIFIVTQEKFFGLMVNHVPHIYPDNILIEPERRNTAAAITYAMFELQIRYGNDYSMIVMPADHHIENEEEFSDNVNKILDDINKDGKYNLFMFGIQPTYPATCYGYIQPQDSKSDLYQCVEKFKEKPDKKTAQKYIDSGFYWNSGIFVWHHEAISNAIKYCLPNHFYLFGSVFKKLGGLSREQKKENIKAVYTLMESISIDYGVLEKVMPHIAGRCVMPATFDWDDMGNWNSLEKYLPQREGDNRSNINIKGFESNNNFVYCKDDIEVFLMNTTDMMVIVANGKVLVGPKNMLQNLRMKNFETLEILSE